MLVNEKLSIGYDNRQRLWGDIILEESYSSQKTAITKQQWIERNKEYWSNEELLAVTLKLEKNRDPEKATIKPLLKIVENQFKDKEEIRIFELGGGLGVNYDILKERENLKTKKIKYDAIESENVIKIGNKNRKKDKNINFIDKLSKSKLSYYDIMFASSSIMYLENPYEFFEEVITKKNPKYICFVRTPLSKFYPTFIVEQISTKNQCPVFYRVFNPNELIGFFKAFKYKTVKLEFSEVYLPQQEFLPTSRSKIGYHEILFERK